MYLDTRIDLHCPDMGQWVVGLCLVSVTVIFLTRLRMQLTVTAVVFNCDHITTIEQCYIPHSNVLVIIGLGRNYIVTVEQCNVMI